MNERFDVADAEIREEGLRAVAEAFAQIGTAIDGAPGAALQALVEVSVARVPGAQAASVSTLRRGTFATGAATDSFARHADAIQYEVGSGPCIDAALEATAYRTGNIQHDERWPEFGRRVSSLGVRSMAAYRLQLDGDDIGDVAALNLYSRVPNAFDDKAMMMGLLLATHGGLTLRAARSSRTALHLTRALESSRLTGTAVGILMSSHRLSQQQAFDLMSVASQKSNVKLVDIATAVVAEGDLPASLDAPQW